MTTASTAEILRKVELSPIINLAVKCRFELFYNVFSVIFVSEMADHFDAIWRIVGPV